MSTVSSIANNRGAWPERDVLRGKPSSEALYSASASGAADPLTNLQAPAAASPPTQANPFEPSSTVAFAQQHAGSSDEELSLNDLIDQIASDLSNASAPNQAGTDAQQAFASLDSNGDGSISPQEFEDAWNDADADDGSSSPVGYAVVASSPDGNTTVMAAMVERQYDPTGGVQSQSPGFNFLA